MKNFLQKGVEVLNDALEKAKENNAEYKEQFQQIKLELEEKKQQNEIERQEKKEKAEAERQQRELERKALAEEKRQQIEKEKSEKQEKRKEEKRQRDLKKYNPIFSEQYLDLNFILPKMIVIVDAAVREGIEVCENAIGWISKENDVEVLHLYEEAVKMTGLRFEPAPTLDNIYYVDKFEGKCFIQTDYIFNKAHEERLAELKHIAYSLGAKRCSIEISESNSEFESSEKGFDLKLFDTGASANTEKGYGGSVQRSGKIIAEFEGSDDVKQPDLKWFANDIHIRDLIDMRCGSRNSIKSETLILEGSVSATMSQKTAVAIDSVLTKLGGNASANMGRQATRENHSRLLFSVEF